MFVGVGSHSISAWNFSKLMWNSFLVHIAKSMNFPESRPNVDLINAICLCYVSSPLPYHKWCHMFQFCIWIIIVIKWTGPWHFVMSLSNIWNYFRESVNTISTYNLNNFSHSLHTNLKYNRIVLLMRCNEISNKGERQSKLFPKFQDFRDLGLMNNMNIVRENIFNLFIWKLN